MTQKSKVKFSFDPYANGYKLLYRKDTVNHCPCCSRSNWIIGRLSAECGFCGTPLPLESAQTGGGVNRQPTEGVNGFEWHIPELHPA
jgi:hypothetical protein